ncbi:hypothetical protein LTR84_011435 [Exophiala bonariae]|uniref:Uncharacterized protein n=1 Tax=Exophiala bonariae TaxID=1690606 RepID=A0AAV9MTH3_9EURO|nr:hypothetical protein LTR84_011435 [Exophiala bonariae]
MATHATIVARVGPRKHHLKLGSGFGVFDPGYIKGEDTELLNWEAAEKTQHAALSRSDHPLTIVTSGKGDETSSDHEVKKSMTISDHELQAGVQSVDSQTFNQSISPSLDTRPSRKELSWERNGVMMDQSPTTLPEVSHYPSFPGTANTVPVMEAPFLLGSATISIVPGGLTSVSLPQSQTSCTESMGTEDAQCQEPYVIPSEVLPQFPSAWSTTISTDGGPYSSPDTVRTANIAGPQNENSTEIPLKVIPTGGVGAHEKIISPFVATTRVGSI